MNDEHRITVGDGFRFAFGVWLCSVAMAAVGLLAAAMLGANFIRQAWPHGLTG